MHTQVAFLPQNTATLKTSREVGGIIYKTRPYAKKGKKRRGKSSVHAGFPCKAQFEPHSLFSLPHLQTHTLNRMEAGLSILKQLRQQQSCTLGAALKHQTANFGAVQV